METEEMARRGAEDAERGDPNPFYYQHYYHYRRSYDRQRRLQWSQSRVLRGVALLIGVVVVVGVLGALVLNLFQGGDTTASVVTTTPAPTATPRPIFPTPTVVAPTPTIETVAVLNVEGFATVSNTQGKALRGRAEPNLQAPILATFTEGERVRLLEGPVEADGLRWWRVEGATGSGWSAEFSLEGDVWLLPSS